MRKNIILLMSVSMLFIIGFVGTFKVPVFAAGQSEAERCTAVYVGKELCEEGTAIIARSEDMPTGVNNKLFLVYPETDHSGGFMEYYGENQNGFKVKIPKKTLRYTSLLDATECGDGPYYSSCMNECGVAVVGTVSADVGEEYAAIDPFKEEGSGIREAIIPGMIACQAVSARKGVELLADYIDQYGSEECNITLFADRDESWIMEIYGGSTYAAMKLPDDKMAVFGNQIMIDWVDLDEKEGFIFSDNLKDCLAKLKSPVKDTKGLYHLAQSIDPGPRSTYSNMRTWRGHQLFAPSSIGEYSDKEFYPLLFTPEKKVSVIDIMQLFGDRYEGTEYDMSKPGNEGNRAIGTTRQSDVHIIQTFADLPKDCCHLQWLCMGNAEHSVFVPAFSGITDTYEKYKTDTDGSIAVNDSYYFLCRSIAAIAQTDRKFLSKGVKEYNLEQEKQMLSSVMEIIPTIKTKYSVSKIQGEEFVTEFSASIAEDQYKKAQNLLQHLLYTQMNNQNDLANDENKIQFSMTDIPD
ncbi:MAG: C69 family dipeptidase [Lachnospiraceae bacterium]|nr:C69 family dipeptidase [Lachnospiraceae bacterium]